MKEMTSSKYSPAQWQQRNVKDRTKGENRTNNEGKREREKKEESYRARRATHRIMASTKHKMMSEREGRANRMPSVKGISTLKDTKLREVQRWHDSQSQPTILLSPRLQPETQSTLRSGSQKIDPRADCMPVDIGPDYKDRKKKMKTKKQNMKKRKKRQRQRKEEKDKEEEEADMKKKKKKKKSVKKVETAQFRIDRGSTKKAISTRITPRNQVAIDVQHVHLNKRREEEERGSKYEQTAGETEQ